MFGGKNGASGGARTSVYGEREHNFKGTTWFYDARFRTESIAEMAGVQGR